MPHLRAWAAVRTDFKGSGREETNLNEMQEIKKEKVILVGLNCPIFKEDETSDEITLAELAALVETAGGEPLATVLQNRPAPDARTFIGEGKCEEVRALADAHEADLIIFDNELSPSQLRSLEELTGHTVLDRPALILDIFAQRARTGEGKLQVELAQYQYILPRLAGLGKAMSRLGGGIGTRGPGESKLESDRRHIRRRIDKLRSELEQVRQVRAVQRRQRKKTELPMVAIVGYTNAGKSTLLNQLTGAGIEANDRLFDTLDPTTRKRRISDTQEVLLSDTVGFIRKLPHHLVSAFKATLEELQYADLLLHVVDISAPLWESQAATVEKVIGQLGAGEIPRVMVYNKADRCDILPHFADGVLFSARTGEGTEALLHAMEAALGRGKHVMQLLIPYSDGGVLDMLHRESEVRSVEYAEAGTLVEAVVDDKTCGRMQKYKVE
ncbi:GTPase HflX [Butyricicoccus sp. 1XD8-22]|nr:GTPase HflX [Butyricicoccus sp. 1XD8-22]